MNNTNNSDLDTLKTEIPPVIDISPFVISESSILHNSDPFVWEQPMGTELAHYKLHKNIPLGDNIDTKRKIINTYLGIPWGRFDAVKYFFPLDLIKFLKHKIQQLKALATQAGYVLKVHTVAQKENWKAFISLFEEIDITDVHGVQYEDHFIHNFNPFRYKKITFHCLPFEAINTEVPGRNEGLKNIPFEEKKYLATFKGAHMPHYKSDIRIVLKDAYNKEKNKSDILVELTDEWFYNKEIFSHFYKTSTEEEKQKEITSQQEKTRMYNELLSNSIFALCPEGGGVNSIRFWEALSIGTIPVLLVSKAELPLMLSIHPDLYKCCYVVFRHNLYTMFRDLREKTKNVSHIKEMSQLCMNVYKQLRHRTTFENQYSKEHTIFSVFL